MGARHSLGPSGVDPEVKRNRLTPQNKFDLSSLNNRRVLGEPLEGLGGGRHCQGPSGIDA